MEDKLRKHIDNLFAETTPTKKSVELKEEMIQNLHDKYNDLITEGKTDEAAYNIAVAGIGDVSDLLAELETDDSSPIYTQDFGNFGIGFNSFTENLTGPFNVDGTYTVDVDSIDSLRINWVAGNVTVAPYDGSQIKITELAQRELNDKEKLGFSVSGDTLTINFRGSNSFRSMPRKQLEVLVPHSLAENLDKLRVETVSGDVNIDNIDANVFESESVSAEIRALGRYDKVTLESVSGNLLLRNDASGSEVKANTVSGRIDLLGAFDKVVIETVSGRMSVSSEIVPESFKSDSVSGSLTILLPAGSTVSVNHSAVSGKLSSDLPVLMEGRGAAFTISSVSGNVNIEILE